MKRSFCVIAAAASLIAALIGSSAMAADFCCAKAPPPPCCALSWTGWYVGFNAGWVGAAGNIPAAIDLGYSGFLGGGQFGYNWQSGIFVYGLEADLDAASAKSGVTLPDARFIPPA